MEGLTERTMIKVKVRAKRALFESSMSICQGAVFETSLERAKWLKKMKMVGVIEKISDLPEIIKLREQGLTYQAIGERLDISKVAVYKQLKRKGLTGKVNLISQVKDLQERVGKLEKTISILLYRFRGRL